MSTFFLPHENCWLAFIRLRLIPPATKAQKDKDFSLMKELCSLDGSQTRIGCSKDLISGEGGAESGSTRNVDNLVYSLLNHRTKYSQLLFLFLLKFPFDQRASLSSIYNRWVTAHPAFPSELKRISIGRTRKTLPDSMVHAASRGIGYSPR